MRTVYGVALTAALLGQSVAAEYCSGTAIHFLGGKANSPQQTTSEGARYAIAHRLGLEDKLELGDDVRSIESLQEFLSSGTGIASGEGVRKGGVIVHVTGLAKGETVFGTPTYCISETEGISLGGLPVLSADSSEVDYIKAAKAQDAVHIPISLSEALVSYGADSKEYRDAVKAALAPLSQVEGFSNIVVIDDHSSDTSHLQRRRQTPMTSHPASPQSVDENSESASSPRILADDEKSKPYTPFSRCYSSKDDCESGTNKCSSHGSCVSKFVKGRPDSKCWVCECEPSKKDDGRVENWAGLACQKKDVSVPFNIFLGLGIILTSLISAAIYLMFSVGGEELPAVLSAGVGGKTHTS